MEAHHYRHFEPSDERWTSQDVQFFGYLSDTCAVLRIQMGRSLLLA